MQGTGQSPAIEAERKRVEAVVETLATLHSQDDTLAAVAHDARNMVSALGLYCDLLEEPGVLAAAYTHYGSELRLVSAASRRLVEKLVALEKPRASHASFWRNEAPTTGHWPLRTTGSQQELWEPLPLEPVADLAAELLATRNLLSALAGPAIVVTVVAEGCALPVRLSAEDLTRVLVNLVRNAMEAMPTGGRIQISLREGSEGGERKLILAVDDSGPGIAPGALERVFESGYSGHAQEPGGHRGLGLAIVQSIIGNAGGQVRAERSTLGGARIAMELPAA